MSATDDIRVLLGEHGVKCKIHDTKKRKDTLWDFRESSHAMFSEYRDGMTVFVMSGSLWTPEQAIAATVGNAALEAENAKLRDSLKALMMGTNVELCADRDEPDCKECSMHHGKDGCTVVDAMELLSIDMYGEPLEVKS